MMFLQRPESANCLKENSKEQINLVETSSQNDLLSASPELGKVRTVSQKQRDEITYILQKYRVHLSSSRRRFGSIDSMTGFTLKLTDSVVANCEFVSSAAQIFSSFQIW